MQDYMEHRLYSIHTSGTRSKFKQKFIGIVIAIMLVFFLPFLHIGIFYKMIWVPDKPQINKDTCSCGCFDTIFRGRYENPPSSYKHFYFNATSNMLGVWFIALLGIICLYEAVKYIFTLIWERHVRWPMLAVLVTAIYPHYYGWWGMIGYLNEDYYPQWYHQIIFSCTEAASTAMVIHLCNKRADMIASKLFFIIVINLQHIIVASLDQFVLNIIHGQGKGFEAVRDFALMTPDLFHVLLPFFELQNIAARKKVPILGLFYKEELMLATLMLVLLTLIFKNM